MLLDDDEAGQTARNRYIEDWSLADLKVNTIASALPSLKGKTIKKALSGDALKIIGASLGKQSATKKEIGQLFQEKFAKGDLIQFDPATKNAAHEEFLALCAKNSDRETYRMNFL